MERCKSDFYVSLEWNICFSRPSCTFSAWETYGSASGNVECGSRFVSLCRWILLFLCGDVNRWGNYSFVPTLVKYRYSFRACSDNVILYMPVLRNLLCFHLHFGYRVLVLNTLFAFMNCFHCVGWRHEVLRFL